MTLLSADIPIATTEAEPGALGNGTTERGSSVKTVIHALPSSGSFSPRLSDASSLEGITSRIQNARLSPSPTPNHFDLSGLAQAVETIPATTFPRGPSLSPGPNGTPRRRRGGRRSSAGIEQSHDVRDEELPDDAFHAPEFQKAFRDAKNLISTVEGVLGSSSLHNTEGATLRRLWKEASELSRFEYPATRTVGFVGDSGVGKSSLLNSLLDTKGLARTSNSGEACTCVVTEYHYHKRDTFDIEVVLFTMDELRTQLKTMLGAYRVFHLFQGNMKPEEKPDAQASAKLAEDTFLAMFRGHFHDADFLVEDNEETVLDKLTQWAFRAQPVSMGAKLTGLSSRACSDALMELSSEPPARDAPARWPYIRSVKVFSNAHILSRGLILVDLPGLRDLNSARRIITERYLLDCNEIFAVCNIGRAVTDEGVLHVFELARRAGLSNVGIVCTRSDDIVAEEAVKDWRGKNAQDIQKMMDAIATDESDEANIKNDLAEYKEGEDLSEDELRDKLDLLHKTDITNISKRNHEFELKAYLVTTRNEFVARELRQIYNERISTDIKIFCVSNKDYWYHRNEPKSKSSRFLNLSGILDVRKSCLAIVANSQRRVARLYIRNQIPAFLAEVGLWVQSGARTESEEKRDTLCNLLNRVESDLRRGLTLGMSDANRVAHSLKRSFMDHIYGNRDIPAWKSSAKHASDEWRKWHHGSYSAFCRNYGNHYTKAVRCRRDWNEEALKGMVTDLGPRWNDFSSATLQQQTQLHEIITDVTDGLIKSLTTGFEIGYSSLATLTQRVSMQQEVLLFSIEKANESFEVELERLRANLLSGIRSSFMGMAMEPSYNKCINDSGGNSDMRRKATISGVMGSSALFNEIMTSCKDAFAQQADRLQEKIRQAVSIYLVIIAESFDLIRSENAARESETDPAFRLRVEDAIKAGNDTMERIHGVI